MRAGIRFLDTRWNAILVDPLGRIADEQSGDLSDEHEISEPFAWLASRPGGTVHSATVDVSGLLHAGTSGQVLVIRVSPRSAVDEIHELAVATDLTGKVSRTVHIAGGHDMRGRPLTPLDVVALERELARIRTTGLVAAITAVGSIANPDHEQRAAAVILEAFPDARISLSHDFFSTALRDRDYTATANAALLTEGDRLASTLERAAREQLPGLPVYFALNDGGCAPIRLLGATPAHALHSARALRIQAARHLSAVDDGDVVVIDDESVVVGHVHGGVPAAQTVVKRGRKPSLASNTARIDRYSSTFLDDALRPAAVVDARSSDGPSHPNAPPPDVVERADLVALGAAVAPLSSWADFLGHASNTTELRHALHAAEDDLASQTMYWGAEPGSIRVVESSAYTLAYGSRNVVRIRVRVIGNWRDDPEPESELPS